MRHKFNFMNWRASYPFIRINIGVASTLIRDWLMGLH